MGLIDRRKTAKNLVDSRRYFKEGAKLTHGCVFYFPATLTPYAR